MRFGKKSGDEKRKRTKRMKLEDLTKEVEARIDEKGRNERRGDEKKI